MPKKKSKKFKVKVTKKGNITVRSKGKKKKGARKKFKVEVKERGNVLTVKIKNVLSLTRPGGSMTQARGSMTQVKPTSASSGATRATKV